MPFDIYTGWIVAFIDGQWRQVFISPGWVTLAPWLRPNEHLGVFLETEAAKVILGELASIGTPIAHSPYALVAAPIVSPDFLERIAIVRFGRIFAGERHYALVDEFSNPSRGIERAEDYDDSNGMDPNWGRYPLPSMPRRWPRTARSLAIS